MLRLLRPRRRPPEERPGRALKRLRSLGGLSGLLFALACLAGAALLVFWRDNIVDPDCLYHAGHARLYWEKGPFFRDFPWASASIIARERADLWWSLHVLTSPIGLVRDPVLGMRLGIAGLVALHLLILGLAYRRFGLSPWWSFASLAASAGLMSRLATLRPQTLSSALLPLLFAELWRRSLPTSVAVGALIGIFHPTLGYILVPIALVTAFSAGRGTSKLPELGAIAAATLCAFVRPGVAGGAGLLKVQTLDLLAVKRLNVIQNFGNELAPANPFVAAGRGYFLFAVLVPLILLALSLLFVRRETLKSPAPASFLLSALFLGVFVLVTKRGVDQFAPFAVLTFALVAGSWKVLPKTAPLLAVGACALSIYVYHGDKVRSVRPITRRFEGASNWLARNTPEGAVVYHSVWSHFADLFFWNRRNRYLGGMDPMFQWAVSPSNYWLTTPIHSKRYAGNVGPEDPARTQAKEIPLYAAAPKYFGARYVMCGFGDAQFRDALRRDKTHYALRFDDGSGYVFEIVKTTR